MSQPPLPYSPQQFPPDFSQFQPAADPLTPARRAGLMLLIVGALMIALGACGGLVGTSASPEQLNQMFGQMHLEQSRLPPGFTSVDFMKAAIVSLAVLCALLGIMTMVSGWFTRRGARWAIISGVALCTVPLLYLALNLLVSLAKGMLNPQMLIESICVLCIPVSLLTLTIIWLIQALRRLPGIQYAQQQYQMQMWQHQQQQAAYQQNPQSLSPAAPPTSNDPWQRGYGMTPPPPPPANVPPPPGA